MNPHHPLNPRLKNDLCNLRNLRSYHTDKLSFNFEHLLTKSF